MKTRASGPRFFCRRRSGSMGSSALARACSIARFSFASITTAILTDAFCGPSGYLCWIDKRESAAWPLPIAIPFLALRACRLYHRAAGDRSRSCPWRLLVRPGIMGIGQGKLQAVEQKPTGTISGQSVSDAQGYTTRGLTLAKSGKSEEALAEFDRDTAPRSLQRAGPVRTRPDLSGRQAA